MKVPVRIVPAMVVVALIPTAAAQVLPPDMLARPCDVDFVVTGAPGDHLGVTLAANGDLDNDGRGDFLMPTMRTINIGSGGACLFDPLDPGNSVQVWALWSSGEPHQLLQIDNVGQMSQQAITVAWVGDLNDGGRDDFVIGVPA